MLTYNRLAAVILAGIATTSILVIIDLCLHVYE
jgi:hypothetical protein